MPDSVEPYEILVEAFDANKLKGEWLALQSRAEHSFFLSWHWIGSWLYTFDPDVQIVKAYYQGKIVGLLAVCRSRGRALKCIPVNTLNCNQTGDPVKDQIWPEYNQMLLDDMHRDVLLPLMMEFLIRKINGWDELVIGASTATVVEELSSASGLSFHEIWCSKSYCIDLSSLRRKGTGYLSTLSRNTRYQIKRSLRQYEAQSPMVLERASSANQAIDFLFEAAPLHLARWGVGINGSGFANEEFNRFHRNLISRTWESGCIDVLRVRCGEVVIAYLYNLIYRGRVYFYLSALKRESDPKLKPGLVSHAMAIEYYLDKGMEKYDFMGGNDRYKKSLADESEALLMVSFRKPKLIYRLENSGRKLKRSMKKPARRFFTSAESRQGAKRQT